MEKYSRRKLADDREVSPSASEASRRARPRKRQQPRRHFSQERCGRGEPPASGNEAGNGACCRKSAALVTGFGTEKPHGHPPPEETPGRLFRRVGTGRPEAHRRRPAVTKATSFCHASPFCASKPHRLAGDAGGGGGREGCGGMPTCGLLARRAGACSANQDTAAGQRRVGGAVGVEEFCLQGSPRGQCTKTDLKVTVFTAVKPIGVSLGFRNGIRPPPSL